jgi:metal-dependent amidase/aminoacylase/carboxypeptidase family protein
VEFFRGALCNTIDGALLAELNEISIDFLGGDRFIDASGFLKSTKVTGTEDFAYVAEKVPSVMMAIGAGSPDNGYVHPQHHPKALFDDSILHIGAGLYTNNAMEWLKKNK